MGRQSTKQWGDRFQRAIIVFEKHGGILRTAEALRAGVHPHTLYTMRDAGIIERLSQGLYRLAEEPPLADLDLITVAKRVPRGVVCLISALFFHDLTTQIPHEVYLALPRGAEEPQIGFPPIRTFRFSGKSFTAGIETYRLDGIPVRIYTPEKTLADCFKFKNKIGLDTAIEALRLYREQRSVKVDELLHFAAICRVAKVMQPYLEAIL